MSLTSQLKQVMDEYFSRYPHVSINSLAMKSGVGASTLRRIANESIKGDPAPHTVLNLASAISNEKNLALIISRFDGPVGELLREAFGPYLERELPHKYCTNLNEELKDWLKYAIYKLAANRQGVSKFKVIELFGKVGLERFMEMQERGLLEIVEGVAHAKEKNFSLDVFIAAEHLPEMVRFYKPDEIAEGKNIFYSLSETVNLEGVRKIKEIQKEAVQRIYEIMASSDYEGEIPYMVLNIADTIELSGARGVLQ